MDARSFTPPWWSWFALLIVLFGASLYVLVLIALNSQIAAADSRLPAWAGWSLGCGLLLLVLVPSYDLPSESMQMPLLVAITLLCVLPAWIVHELRGNRATVTGIAQRTAGIIQQHSGPLIFLCSLALALGVFGRSIWMDWTMFDDHQIMQFVGPGRGLSFSEMWALLPQTEIGQYGVSLRFRPTYWFLRLLECVLWGARPALWHAFRVLILVLSLSVFWTLLTRCLGWVAAGLLCAYTLTFPYWAEIFTLLGPGETYAVGGLALYLLGMHRMAQRLQNGVKAGLFPCAALFIGSLLSIGSKENFVLLAIPTAYLGFLAVRHKDAMAIIAASASAMFALYVASGAVLAVAHQGVDVYAHPVDPLDRVVRVFQSLREVRSQTPLLMLVTLAVVPGALALTARAAGSARKPLLKAQGWLTILSLVYLSQLLFYNGEWPTGTRYDFPGLLYIPATLVILSAYSTRVIHSADQSNFSRVWQLAISLALAVLILVRGYGGSVKFVEGMVQSSNQFVQSIEETALILRAHPDHALVLESGSVSDYEFVFSHEEFLRAYGVENKIFLRLHGYSVATAVYTQETKLVTHLTEVSSAGAKGFTPLNDLGVFGPKCYSLSLSTPIATECTPIE